MPEEDAAAEAQQQDIHLRRQIVALANEMDVRRPGWRGRQAAAPAPAAARPVAPNALHEQEEEDSMEVDGDGEDEMGETLVDVPIKHEIVHVDCMHDGWRSAARRATLLLAQTARSRSRRRHRLLRLQVETWDQTFWNCHSRRVKEQETGLPKREVELANPMQRTLTVCR